MNKTVACPHCGQINEVINASLYSGKKIRIPCGNKKCGQKFEFVMELKQEDQHTEITKKNVYGRSAELVLIESEFHRGGVFKLNKGEEIFGRKSNVSIKSGQIDSSDNTISRNHFKITGIREKRTENVKFILEDLHSTNSLFLNGLELKSIIKPVLQHEDKISFGNSTIIFRYTDIETNRT